MRSKSAHTLKRSTETRETGPSLWWLKLFAVLVLVLTVSGLYAHIRPQTVQAAPPPTVDGLFYGEDEAVYTLWDTSYYSSTLYVHYDAPNTTLYVAMVVDPSVNDNVFTNNSLDGSAYMQSVGWGGGGGQQRSAASLTDSEFGAFTFACDTQVGPSWTWKQAYACAPDSPGDPWKSAADCGAGSGATPESYDSASSFVWNINNYRGKYGTTAPPSGSPPWNMYTYGTTKGDWKSPFSDPNAVPGDYSGYSATYEWEWRMVYEWSVDLVEAGCGSNALYLISGLSHHSPMKGGVEELYDDDCGEENDCFPPPSGGGDPDPFTDWGDLPDSYGTLAASNGPRHTITALGPYLGNALDSELDGQPAAGATGDGADEDGVTLVTPLIAGAEACIKVDAVVTGTVDAVLQGWIDFNSDGDFVGDANEALDFADSSVPVGGVTDQNYCFTVPPDAALVGGETYMRFRLSGAGGLSYNGPADDGEVEDYYRTLACAGNMVWFDADGDHTQSGETTATHGLNGVGVQLVWAGPDGVLDSGGDDVIYSTTTASDGTDNGTYSFCGLVPGTYRTQVPSPPASYPLAATAGQGGDVDKDSDGIQASGTGTSVAGPSFTIGDPISLRKVEDGLGDKRVNGYPDTRDDVSFDYGFQEAPTSIQLASFSATVQAGTIQLAWETATELDNLGFNLYRADSADGPRTQLNAGLIASQHLGLPLGASYRFADESAQAGMTYYYWLEAVDAFGATRMHGPISAELSPLRRLLPTRPRLTVGPTGFGTR